MKSRNFKALLTYTVLMNTYYFVFFYVPIDWIYAKAFCAAIIVGIIIWLIYDLLTYSNADNQQMRIVILATMAINTALCSLISLDAIMNGVLCLFLFNILVFAITKSLLRNLNKYGYFKK